MGQVKHEMASFALSVLAGMVLAVTAIISDRFAIPYAIIALPVGAGAGVVLLPAALFARWDAECRLSFLWVVVPSTVATFLGSVVGGVPLGALVSVPAYLISCGVVGGLAIPRRRRLNWYRSGYCSTCGYDVRGLGGDLCPECGNIARVRPKIRVGREIMRP